MDEDPEVECIVFGWTVIAEDDLRAAAERAARATDVTVARITYAPDLSTIGIAGRGKQAWFDLVSTEVGSDLSIDPISDDFDDPRWTEFLHALATELGGEIDFEEIDRRNSLRGGVGVIPYGVSPQKRSEPV